MNIVYFADFWTLLWLVAAVGGVVLFRRSRGVPTLLLMIGAFGWLCWSLTDSLFTHQVVLPALVDRYGMAVDTIERLFRFAAACLPVGLAWLAFRSGRRT